MGLTEPTNNIYLKVSLGRIRRTTTKDDPKAEVRTNANNEEVYERIFKDCSGVLRQVVFNHHDEYGNSWNLHLEDNGQIFVLQFTEKSRYGTDMLKKLPNMKLGVEYKITPFDYVKNNKPRAGVFILAVKDKMKIGDYYHQYTDLGNDQWEIKPLNDFPEYKGDPKDEDEWRIYYMRVTKFLREKSQELLKQWNTEECIEASKHLDGHEEPVPSTPPAEDDDLPF